MFNHLYRTILGIIYLGYVSVVMAQTTSPSQAARQKGEADPKEFPCLEEYGNLKNRPKRAFIGVDTRIGDASFSRYAKIWADQIEANIERNQTPGRNNPGTNVESKIMVEILPRGQVGVIEIDRSSGFKNLDEAAVAIIKSSAPFAPLPQDVCAKVDILHMVSTIQFTSSGARLKRAQ